MAEKKIVEALINGGQATAGPPLGPALGPLGVNVLAVVNKINELTSSYAGMRVPVKIIVDVDTKEFEVEIGMPTTSALIVKEAEIQKGSSTPNRETAGNISFEQAVKIAKIKMSALLARNLKAAVKEIVGTCLSMGVTIDGKNPKTILEEIDSGKYDEFIEKAGEQ